MPDLGGSGMLLCHLGIPLRLHVILGLSIQVNHTWRLAGNKSTMDNRCPITKLTSGQMRNMGMSQNKET